MDDADALFALLGAGFVVAVIIEITVKPRLLRFFRRNRLDPMADAHGDAPFNPWTDRHG